MFSIIINHMFPNVINLFAWVNYHHTKVLGAAAWAALLLRLWRYNIGFDF